MNAPNSSVTRYTHTTLRNPVTAEALRAASNHITNKKFNLAIRIYFLLVRNENNTQAKEALGSLFESTDKTNDLIAFFLSLPNEMDRNQAFAMMGHIFKYGLGVKPNLTLALECFMIGDVDPDDQVLTTLEAQRKNYQLSI